MTAEQPTAKGAMNYYMMTTTGVRPINPVFFFDFDKASLAEIIEFTHKEISGYYDFDIYQTSNARYHLVAAMPTWDAVQDMLYRCKKHFPKEQYILSCRRLRLRVTAKTDRNGIEIVPAPFVMICGCKSGHRDKRVGTLEVYETKW